MPSHIVPFAPDGRGNYYCFDTKQNNEIVFYTSNYNYSETDKPEVVNSDFCDWFNEVMIDWCIELEGQDYIYWMSYSKMCFWWFISNKLRWFTYCWSTKNTCYM